MYFSDSVNINKSMKKLRTPFIIVLAVICFFVFGIVSGLFGVGGYPYAQKYEFSNDRRALIENIEALKAKNPDFSLPDTIGIVDHADSFGNYHIYIYYPLDKEIVHFFISGEKDQNNNSYLYLVNIRKISPLEDWQIINKDFPRKDNIAIKNRFRKTILDELHLPYHDKGNGMWIFWK
jgi:hypothetical protein